MDDKLKRYYILVGEWYGMTYDQIIKTPAHIFFALSRQFLVEHGKDRWDEYLNDNIEPMKMIKRHNTMTK